MLRDDVVPCCVMIWSYAGIADTFTSEFTTEFGGRVMRDLADKFMSDLGDRYEWGW